MAIVWVGGAVAVQLFALRAQASTEPGRMATLTADAEWIGMKIFMPTSIVLLLMGILMTVDRWAFEDPWIVIGIIGILFSIGVGAGFLGPESGRLKQLIATKGPSDPEVESRIKRIFLISRIELVVLFVVVFAMVTKVGA
jgi:hypothetical protein